MNCLCSVGWEGVLSGLTPSGSGCENCMEARRAFLVLGRTSFCTNKRTELGAVPWVPVWVLTNPLCSFASFSYSLSKQGYLGQDRFGCDE